MSTNKNSNAKFTNTNLNNVLQNKSTAGSSQSSSLLGSAKLGFNGMLVLSKRPRAVTGAKLAVPLPVNLPSMKKEHGGNDPTTQLVSSGASGSTWTKPEEPNAVPTSTAASTAPTTSALAEPIVPRPTSATASSTWVGGASAKPAAGSSTVWQASSAPAKPAPIPGVRGPADRHLNPEEYPSLAATAKGVSASGKGSKQFEHPQENQAWADDERAPVRTSYNEPWPGANDDRFMDDRYSGNREYNNYGRPPGDDDMHGRGRYGGPPGGNYTGNDGYYGGGGYSRGPPPPPPSYYESGGGYVRSGGYPADAPATYDMLFPPTRSGGGRGAAQSAPDEEDDPEARAWHEQLQQKMADLNRGKEERSDSVAERRSLASAAATAGDDDVSSLADSRAPSEAELIREARSAFPRSTASSRSTMAPPPPPPSGASTDRNQRSMDQPLSAREQHSAARGGVDRERQSGSGPVPVTAPPPPPPRRAWQPQPPPPAQSPPQIGDEDQDWAAEAPRDTRSTTTSAYSSRHATSEQDTSMTTLAPPPPPPSRPPPQSATSKPVISPPAPVKSSPPPPPPSAATTTTTTAAIVPAVTSPRHHARTAPATAAATTKQQALFGSFDEETLDKLTSGAGIDTAPPPPPPPPPSAGVRATAVQPPPPPPPRSQDVSSSQSVAAEPAARPWRPAEGTTPTLLHRPSANQSGTAPAAATQDLDSSGYSHYQQQSSYGGRGAGGRGADISTRGRGRGRGARYSDSGHPASQASGDLSEQSDSRDSASGSGVDGRPSPSGGRGGASVRGRGRGRGSYDDASYVSQAQPQPSATEEQQQGVTAAAGQPQEREIEVYHGYARRGRGARGGRVPGGRGAGRGGSYNGSETNSTGTSRPGSATPEATSAGGAATGATSAAAPAPRPVQTVQANGPSAPSTSDPVLDSTAANMSVGKAPGAAVTPTAKSHLGAVGDAKTSNLTSQSLPPAPAAQVVMNTGGSGGSSGASALAPPLDMPMLPPDLLEMGTSLIAKPPSMPVQASFQAAPGPRATGVGSVLSPSSQGLFASTAQGSWDASAGLSQQQQAQQYAHLFNASTMPNPAIFSTAAALQTGQGGMGTYTQFPATGLNMAGAGFSTFTVSTPTNAFATNSGLGSGIFGGTSTGAFMPTSKPPDWSTGNPLGSQSPSSIQLGGPRLDPQFQNLSFGSLPPMHGSATSGVMMDQGTGMKQAGNTLPMTFAGPPLGSQTNALPLPSFGQFVAAGNAALQAAVQKQQHDMQSMQNSMSKAGGATMTLPPPPALPNTMPYGLPAQPVSGSMMRPGVQMTGNTQQQQQQQQPSHMTAYGAIQQGQLQHQQQRSLAPSGKQPSIDKVSALPDELFDGSTTSSLNVSGSGSSRPGTTSAPRTSGAAATVPTPPPASSVASHTVNQHQLVQPPPPPPRNVRPAAQPVQQQQQVATTQASAAAQVQPVGGSAAQQQQQMYPGTGGRGGRGAGRGGYGGRGGRGGPSANIATTPAAGVATAVAPSAAPQTVTGQQAGSISGTGAVAAAGGMKPAAPVVVAAPPPPPPPASTTTNTSDAGSVPATAGTGGRGRGRGFSGANGRGAGRAGAAPPPPAAGTTTASTASGASTDASAAGGDASSKGSAATVNSSHAAAADAAGGRGGRGARGRGGPAGRGPGRGGHVVSKQTQETTAPAKAAPGATASGGSSEKVAAPASVPPPPPPPPAGDKAVANGPSAESSASATGGRGGRGEGRGGRNGGRGGRGRGRATAPPPPATATST